MTAWGLCWFSRDANTASKSCSKSASKYSAVAAALLSSDDTRTAASKSTNSATATVVSLGDFSTPVEATDEFRSGAKSDSMEYELAGLELVTSASFLPRNVLENRSKKPIASPGNGHWSLGCWVERCGRGDGCLIRRVTVAGVSDRLGSC